MFSIEEAKHAFDLICNYISAKGLSSIEITDDYYWNVCWDAFDFQKTPSLYVGSLYDDIAALDRIKKDKDMVNNLSVMEFAHVMLYFAHKMQLDSNQSNNITKSKDFIE